MENPLLQSLEWRLVGPHRGGRVVAVAGHPTERATFYFGACAGGVWKTTSGGAYWENCSDGYFGTAAVGALAVSDSDPNVIYAGMGEATIRSNVSHGDGVYKSTDGGHSWTNVGLRDTRHIGDLGIDPRDPNTVYVAALGHAWGRNEERGVFRTRDGGRSWERVLYKSDRAGSPDVALDPANPRVLFASLWQAQRYPYALHSGGEDSGLWRSTDGGDSWTEITRNQGLPKGMLGKIGVAVSPARPGRVWALVEAEDGALFRSDDYGETWERLSDSPDLRRRPWYYLHVFADPRDADTVWVLNLGCWKSTDGGRTFDVVPTPHGDNHGLWIDPRDPESLIEGNDGGACVSYDGRLIAWNPETGQKRNVTVWPEVHGSGAGPILHRYRFQWTFPVEVSPHDPGALYVCSNHVHRSTDEGASWEVISPDLTRNDPDKLQRSGGPITADNSGAEIYCTIFAFLESRHEPGLFWAGSDDGIIHLSRDGGKTWDNVTPPALPEWTTISMIEPSPHDPA